MTRTVEIPDIRTALDPDVELCTLGGVGHDWRPYEHVSLWRWRCVWCHAVACGPLSHRPPCMLVVQHDGVHRSASGLRWSGSWEYRPPHGS